ncbi:MAG: histidine--tRNA ligase [Candidatus Pacebacteria bacterium]|nr:histidine--tRNA ligase [Candidatus Paceibacterota bacterium]
MTKKLKFQAPTGMHDILPEEQRYFQKIYSVVEDIAKFYGFEKIDTPILEDAELFSKGVGMSTDIVGKEMFSLRTKGGDYLALRPEGTAPTVRAFIENGMINLPQPVKLWYFGPFFRYEHPQAGRFREFWQFGFENFGEQNAVIDAQTIQIFYNILQELKLKNLVIEINCIGDSQCRPYYKKLLTSYFRSRESALCPDCRRRLRENPLRILDCKEEKCQPVKSQAPQIIDHLCEICHKHFKDVLEFLDGIELPYRLNPYLVRGLDYYTKTVFEIFTETNEEIQKQSALAGGGRYDTLVKLLGGRDTPACGAAAGVNRIVELMRERSQKQPKEFEAEVFLAQLGNLAKKKSLKLIEEFRKEKITIGESLGRDSLKAQLVKANKMGVKYTLILGQQEALDDKIIIRDMKIGKQETVKLDKVVREISKKIKK